MAASLVYSGIFGAVLASICAVSTRMVVFDTAVVDLTDDLQDPVDLLNGTITNDKFCMSRKGRLHLSWWRMPLRARVAVMTDREYPSDANEMECCHQEGTHEETSVEHPASHERYCRCATKVGSSLPVSYSMEQRVPEGVSSRAHSTGEQQ